MLRSGLRHGNTLDRIYQNLYNPGSVAKPITWLGSSLEDIKAFPEEARRSAGFQLRRVQEGLAPNDWKPMPDVGAGVQEIRLHAAGEHRVLYVARFAEAVYVLHGFEKKTRRTPKRDLELARKRYGDLVQMRRRERHEKRWRQEEALERQCVS